MPRTNEHRILSDIFNVNGLDLLTEDEKTFNDKYVKKLLGYAEGKVEGVEIKNLTAGAATIAKRQQSRSAVALMKWNMVQKLPELPGGERPSLECKQEA
jgi:hypothetical protein